MIKNVGSRAIVLAGALSMCGYAGAEILQFQFVDQTGVEKSVQPALNSLNPKSSFSVYVSAGLDRRIRLSLLRADESVVSSVTGGLIGAADKILVNGKTYYGSAPVLNKPIDGDYNLLVETLSSTGEIINTERTELTFDTVAPRLGEWDWKFPYGRGTAADGLPIFSYTEAWFLSLSSSDISDISKATFTTYEQSSDGSKKEVAKGLLNIDINGKTIMMGTGARDSITTAMIPAAQGKYSVDFSAEDKAGNISTKTLDFWNNSICGDVPEAVAIEDKSYLGQGFMGLAGFRPIGGLAKTPVTAIPARVMFKLPTNQVKAMPEGAIFGGLPANVKEYTIVKSEGGYTYFIIREVIAADGKMNWSQVGWTNDSRWRCSAFEVKSPDIKVEAQPPVYGGSEVYIDGYGWIPASPLTVNSLGTPISRDVVISQIRAKVSPRNYKQIVDFGTSPTPIGTCEVAPGAEGCVLTKNYPFNTSGTVGVISTNPYVYKADDVDVRVYGTVMRWHWDAQDPVVQSLIEHDKLTKSVKFTATEYNTGANQGLVKMVRGGLLARNAAGSEVRIDGEMFTTNSVSTFSASYKALKSGVWDIYGWARDAYNNDGELKLFSIDNDAEPPIVSIEKASTQISSLEQLKIRVSDNKTAKPKITEIKLEGGPNASSVYLATQEISNNYYGLEYPVIFPSSGAAYKLSVTAKDDAGNTTTESLSFQYDPPSVGLQSGDFSIPALGHYAWAHPNGNLPFTSKQLLNYEGVPLTGAYPLVATLSAQSTSGAITINGVTLKPNETKSIGTYDFTKTQGVLSLPVYSETNGTQGRADILVSSGAPGASIVVGSFNVWTPSIIVDSENTKLEGKVLVDIMSVGLEDKSRKCNWRPAGEIDNTVSDIITNPSCYNTVFENGLEFQESSDYSILKTRLTTISTIAVPPINTKGAKIKGNYINSKGAVANLVLDLPVQSSGLALVSRDASDSVKFGGDNAEISVYRSIQPIEQRLSQTSGPTCGSITSREADAIASGAKMQIQKGIASVACYFKWTATPPGMEVGDNEQQSFRINGTIDKIGRFPIAWELIAYTPLGADHPVTLSRQAMTVEVSNPPAPVIEVQSNRSVFDNLYTVQKKPTNIGVVNITGQPEGAVTYKVLRGGSVIADSSDKTEYARKTATYRLNSDPQDSLWLSQSYTLQASYVKLPEIVATKEIRTVTVPDDDMSMKVSSDTAKALSTETIPVTIGFYNKSNTSEKYNVQNAGQWSVRLVDVKSAKNRRPLSSWVNVDSDGTATIDLPLALNAGEVMRVGSEGTLLSRLDGFEMSKLSTNTLNLTVLDASPVAGSLKSHKLSGVAPLSVGTSIVSNRKDLISEVLWEISSDGGKSWSSIEGAPTAASKMLSHTYDAGIYTIRAKLINKNSQATSYTSTLEIQAYHVPSAKMIDGASVLLPGQKAEKHVTDKDGVVLKESDDIVFEWSTDRGETWIKTNNKFVFDNSTDIGNYPLWSRIRYATSPADDSYAYKIVKTMVSVRKVAKVTVSLVGTTQPEVNRSNLYTTTVKLPYSNMEGQLAGRFTLPDGSKVDGFSLDYRPTELPNANQTITFEAWIQGYENDSKRSVSKKLRTWEYNWPVFSLRKIINPSTYAPMSLDLRVENVGSLSRIEGLTYAWDLPESEAFALASAQSGTRRNVTITEPGEYPVSVTISDDRGNVTTLEDTLVITEAPPWIIDMTWTGSNPSNRAVLDVRTKPQITRGHKYDNITGYSYKVNGVQVGSSTRYTSFSLTEPGRYELSLDLTTELGFGGHGSTIIEVQENKKPECSLNVKQTSTAYVVTAKCSDPDGKMASYEWLVNGDTQSLKGSSISISKRTYPSQPTIQLTGVDDSGGRSEPVVW